MRRIRLVEETIAGRYAENRMRCPTHLSVGQEGVAAAVGLALRPSDYAVSGHRAHAHYLAKGGSLPRMMAEIYGKETGCARGKGGSMHLVDDSVGFMGSTAIVGGSIPVGVGLALAAQMQKTHQISCVFLGDGAIEEGVFFESANFAVLRKLPVLFLCENNFYSVYSHLSKRQPAGREIHSVAAAIGMRAQKGDGNRPEQVYQATAEAVARIRAGGGPEFLEFVTYRWREHCGPNFDNDIGYRTEAEYEEWKRKDPVAYYEARLLKSQAITPDSLRAMDAELAREVSEAFAFAEESPFPAPSELGRHLYFDGEGV